MNKITKKKKTDSKEIKNWLRFESEKDPAFLHHQKTLQPFLNYWQSKEKLPHSLLVTGSNGTGKRPVIDFLVRWIFCENSIFKNPLQEEDLFGSKPSNSPLSFPCGQCHSCMKSLSGNWVDFKELGPDLSEDTKVHKIKIDQLRVIHESLGHGPMEAPCRIFLISQAEKMTAQAANSLLKVLEEPPPNWFLILSTQDESLVLPTLLSRCQRLRIKPYPQKTLFKILDHQLSDKSKIREITDRAQGNLTLALSMEKKEYWNDLKKIKKFIKNPKNHLSDLLEWCNKNPKHLGFTVNELERDCLETLQKNPTDKIPFDKFEKLSYARQLLETPVNKKLLIQNILTNHFN